MSVDISESAESEFEPELYEESDDDEVQLASSCMSTTADPVCGGP